MPTRLSVCRPSPTTVFFSVSNAPSRSSITAKLKFYLEVILRILVFAFLLLVISAKTGHLIAQDAVIPWDNIWSSTIGTVACHIAGDHNWLLVATGSGLGVYLVFRKGYTGLQLNFHIKSTGPICLEPTLSIETSITDGLCSERGITSRHSRARNPNLDVFRHVLVNSRNKIYSDHPNPRYRHP
jgi:hypothetical protein